MCQQEKSKKTKSPSAAGKTAKSAGKGQSEDEPKKAAAKKPATAAAKNEALLSPPPKKVPKTAAAATEKKGKNTEDEPAKEAPKRGRKGTAPQPGGKKAAKASKAKE